MSPAVDSRHQPGSVPILVGGDPAASTVRILGWDDSVLGEARRITAGVWEYDRNWDSGTKHVKAEQVVNGEVSPASSLIQFHVN